ncbi:hypothetical protein LGM58_41770 [Burkholderia contaminans]|uniref:hypothetical protein n=1 Tax=Burkholderia contaminans TaxID=488447 RepID=UPI001CF4E125|nr:hypothetical protein [Burkholderia contaminans]MCA7889710.1 hypothetical protein [Burkholderia contaminans]
MPRSQPSASSAKKPKRGLWYAYRTSLLGDISVISKSAKRTRERLAVLADLARKEARRETFTEAVARQGLSDEQLLHTQQSLELKAAVWFALCAVAFTFLVTSAVSVHPISQAGLSIGVLTLAASHAIKARFRAAQIRRRELFDFAVWLFGGPKK